jgi:sporulation protein YlmC with PRC-barrel domain
MNATRNIFLGAASALVLLAVNPAVAQETDGPVENAAEATGEAVSDAADATMDAAQDAAEATADAAGDAAEETQEMAGEAAEETQEMAGEATEETREMASGDGGEQVAEGLRGAIIASQPDGSHLASAMMDAEVMNAAGEQIGDVNDLIITDGGELTGLIVGVGGFLGVGEKEVAVEMSGLQQTTGPNGGIRFTLDTTAEELDAAPAFEEMAMR